MGWFDALRALFSPRRMPALDPDAFTEGVAERLRQAVPGAVVRVTTRLSLAVDGVAGVQQVFLDNVYRFASNTADPDERESIIGAWLASVTGAAASDGASPDDIVPVLKSPDWFAALPGREDGSRPDHRVEALNDHLAIVYAVDTPHNVSYVEAAWFDGRGVLLEGLRRRAVDNLRAKLPGIGVQRGGGLNLVLAGGYFEASVLLFDDFWEREAPRLRGEAVVAVPARDVLIFCDGGDARAVEDLRRHAHDIHADAAYALSPHLFRRLRDGQVLPLVP